MYPLTLHKASCTYIHFWKGVVSKHGGSTEATHECSRGVHDFYVCLSNILRICSGEIQICNSCSVRTYKSPGYGSAVNSKKWPEKTSYQAKGPEIKFCVIFHHGFIRICGHNGCSKSNFNNGVMYLKNRNIERNNAELNILSKKNSLKYMTILVNVGPTIRQ